MISYKLYGFGIRGFNNYPDWKPKKDEKLVCTSKTECVIVSKRGKQGMRVGSVPTELQRVFKEFLIHGGTISPSVVSTTPRRVLTKGEEIVVIYELEGRADHPLKQALKDIKSVVDEARKTDKKIMLKKNTVVQENPSTSKRSSKKPARKKEDNNSTMVQITEQEDTAECLGSAENKGTVKRKRTTNEDEGEESGGSRDATVENTLKTDKQKKTDKKGTPHLKDVENPSTSKRSSKKPVPNKDNNSTMGQNTEPEDTVEGLGNIENKGTVKRKRTTNEDEGEETGGSGDATVEKTLKNTKQKKTDKKGSPHLKDVVQNRVHDGGMDENKSTQKKGQARKVTHTDMSEEVGLDIGDCGDRENQRSPIQDANKTTNNKDPGTQKEMKVYSKVGGFGGNMKLDGQVFPTHNRFSMGHLFTKIQDDTMHEDLVNKLPIEMKSVGLLVYRGERGTVFRVGSKYLMTSCHVVKPIIDPEGTGKANFFNLEHNDVYVTFGESACDRNGKHYHLEAYIRFGLSHDFAVLAISDPDENLPKALRLEVRDNPMLKKVWLTGFGHGSSKKTLDPSCNIVLRTSLQMTEAMQCFDKNMSYYKKEMIKNGIDETFADELITYGFSGCNNPEKLLMHAWLQHGGSGSPVLAEDSQILKVVGIFTGGLPEFYFYLPEKLKIEYNKEHRFEAALKMCYVYESIKAADPLLASDLFSL